MSRVRKPPGVLRSILVIVGGALFLIAGLIVHRSASPYPDGVSTTGTITDISSGRGDRGRLMYTAIYTFVTDDGRTVSFEDPGSGSHRPTVGERVTVSYQPATPELARRIPGFDWFGWSIIAVGCGIGALGVRDLVRAAQRLFARRIVSDPADYRD